VYRSFCKFRFGRWQEEARRSHGVKLIVADDHAGLKAARRAVLPSVPWQRCQFHLQQNASQFVTRQEARKTVAAMLRTIFNAPDKMEAERLLQSALEAWRKEHPKLAQWAEIAVPESLTVFDFPAAHRVRLRTTNFDLARRTRRRMRPARSISTSTRNHNFPEPMSHRMKRPQALVLLACR
jgi:transposase-like protein